MACGRSKAHARVEEELVRAARSGGAHRRKMDYKAASQGISTVSDTMSGFRMKPQRAQYIYSHIYILQSPSLQKIYSIYKNFTRDISYVYKIL